MSTVEITLSSEEFEKRYVPRQAFEAKAAALAACQRERDAMKDACRKLLDYRKRAGAVAFQLEKADDYMHEIERALEPPARAEGEG